MDESVLSGGSTNRGKVVRVGDTLRRPRTAGHEVVEALLVHLEAVHFGLAPRFLGVDDQGRQVLSFVPGEALPSPPWQLDDVANARRLGDVASALRDLHAATQTFAPPPGMAPRRPLPLPGDTWTHGDLGYANIVYANDRIVGLIDWEFAAPAHHLHGAAALLAMEIRGPRPDVDPEDAVRREAAARMALASIAAGAGCDDAEAAELPRLAAVVLDDAAEYWADLARPSDVIERTRWRAGWFRANAERIGEG